MVALVGEPPEIGGLGVYLVRPQVPVRPASVVNSKRARLHLLAGQILLVQRTGHNTSLRIGRFLAVLVGFCALLGTSWCACADELYRTAVELNAKYVADIEQLAAWCEGRGLSEQARQTRRCLSPQDPYKLYVPVLPEKVGRAELPPDAPPEVVEWDGRLARLRRDQAGALFELARRAVRSHRVGLAYDLAMAAVRANPDHEALRRLLGFQEYLGQWHTADEVRNLRAGQVWHAKFGWLPKAYVGRYEQGQRYSRGRWISAAEDAAEHRDIRDGWLVETEHYTIRSNHSLEAGVALGTKLERLQRLWRQLFVRYYATEAQVVAMFDGRARGIQTPKYHVVYFRDREDYNRSLRGALPKIEISVGVYYAPTRTAYFFAGKDSEDRNLCHEATHQLFHQSRRVSPDVGQKANFWIIEGIALYMESLREEDGYYVLGGFEDQRMIAARYRLLQDNFYVPLQELTTYGMEKVQKHPQIATLYSQAAGLTNFLIHYEGGRYRDALVAYLSDVYSGRDTPDTLAQLTGSSYDQLDKQYRQFMEASLRKGVGGPQ